MLSQTSVCTSLLCFFVLDFISSHSTNLRSSSARGPSHRFRLPCPSLSFPTQLVMLSWDLYLRPSYYCTIAL
ncbi:hypothetical protein BDY24DRAFT_383987 [Mrakia frigida]|uniref:uncharacterized protein n=1 Tax=Mrakia frigida TaxID=29902 RepID=UPI003FCBFF94